MAKKLLFFSKITVALVFSLCIVRLFSTELFVENTPEVRTDIASRAQGRVMALIGSNVKEKLKDKPLVPLTKGIYAKENNEVRYTEMKLDEIEMVEYVFNVNGKEIKIHVPKGQNPPPKYVLEKLQ